jgi:omega-amidase
MFLVGLNRVGTDGKGLVYSGDSAIYSPYGEKLTKEYSHQEKIIECEISKTSLEEIRRDLNFLEHV